MRICVRAWEAVDTRETHGYFTTEEQHQEKKGGFVTAVVLCGRSKRKGLWHGPRGHAGLPPAPVLQDSTGSDLIGVFPLPKPFFPSP